MARHPGPQTSLGELEHGSGRRGALVVTLGLVGGVIGGAVVTGSDSAVIEGDSAPAYASVYMPRHDNVNAPAQQFEQRLLPRWLASWRLPTASTCMNLLKLPDFKVRYVQYTICAGMVWVTILSSSVFKKSNGNSIIY